MARIRVEAPVAARVGSTFVAGPKRLAVHLTVGDGLAASAICIRALARLLRVVPALVVRRLSETRLCCKAEARAVHTARAVKNAV